MQSEHPVWLNTLWPAQDPRCNAYPRLWLQSLRVCDCDTSERSRRSLALRDVRILQDAPDKYALAALDCLRPHPSPLLSKLDRCVRLWFRLRSALSSALSRLAIG